MLRYTVAPKRRWLTIDPLSGITLPRKQVTVEQIYLTYAKVENLAEEADKIDPAISSTLVRFLAYVGPRIGEVTALRVSDKDFEKRRASVLRTWKEDDKGKPVLARIFENLGTQACCDFQFLRLPPQKGLFRATTRCLRFPPQTRRAHQHKELV